MKGETAAFMETKPHRQPLLSFRLTSFVNLFLYNKIIIIGMKQVDKDQVAAIKSYEAHVLNISLLIQQLLDILLYI